MPVSEDVSKFVHYQCCCSLKLGQGYDFSNAEITCVCSCAKTGLVGVGTRTGQIRLFDVRRLSPISQATFHLPDDLVITADNREDNDSSDSDSDFSVEKKKRLEEQERVNVEARHREYQIVSMQIHPSGISLACAV